MINLCPVSKLLSIVESSEPPGVVPSLTTYPKFSEKSSSGASHDKSTTPLPKLSETRVDIGSAAKLAFPTRSFLYSRVTSLEAVLPVKNKSKSPSLS